jgi:hypothetical protein
VSVCLSVLQRAAAYIASCMYVVVWNSSSSSFSNCSSRRKESIVQQAAAATLRKRPWQFRGYTMLCREQEEEHCMYVPTPHPLGSPSCMHACLLQYILHLMAAAVILGRVTKEGWGDDDLLLSVAIAESDGGNGGGGGGGSRLGHSQHCNVLIEGEGRSKGDSCSSVDFSSCFSQTTDRSLSLSLSVGRLSYVRPSIYCLPACLPACLPTRPPLHLPL